MWKAAITAGMALVAVVMFAALTAELALSPIGGYERRHRITLYSGGEQVGDWISQGHVQQQSFGGCSFIESSTEKRMTVRGTVVIVELGF